MVDNLEIAGIDVIYGGSGEGEALGAEFKISLNAYLTELVASPIRTLADAIAFNNKHSDLVSTFRRGCEHLLAVLQRSALENVTNELIG